MVTVERPIGVVWPRHFLVMSIAYGVLFIAFDRLVTLFPSEHGISLWYPAAGLSLALAFSLGITALPVIAVVTYISGLLVAPVADAWYIGAMAAVHTAAYLGAGLVLRRTVERPTFDQLRDIVRLVIACFAAPIVSSLFGCLLLVQYHLVTWDAFVISALSWWLGDSVGAMVLAPFLLVVVYRRIQPGGKTQRAYAGETPSIGPLELLAQALALLGTIWLIFFSPLAPLQPIFYCFLPLTLIALRGGMPAATTSILALSFGAIISAYELGYSYSSILKLQQAILVLALTGLILAVLVEQQWRATGALRENEARARAIVQDQIDLICRFRPDLTLTFVNEAYCRFFGRRPDQLLGASFLPLSLPEYHASIRAEVAAIIATREPLVNESLIYRGDGMLRWMQWVNRAIVDSYGDVEIQVVGRDVTERRRAEEAYRSLVDQSVQGLAIIQDQQLVFVNPALCEILGYQAEELVTIDTLFRVIAPEDHRRVIDQILSFDPSQWGGRSIELRIVQKSGAIRWVTIAVVNTMYDGRPAAMAMLIDVTARKAAEAALQKSEDRYRIVSELTSDYAYAYTRGEDGQLYMEWLAGAFTGITGYTNEEVDELGGWEMIVHPDDRAVMIERRSMLYAGRPYSNEVRINRKDGELRWLQISIRPQLDSEGELLHIYGAVRDITERKRAEEERMAIERQLQETQKLESLGLLAGGIAHDFNNLLVAVMGHAEIAESQIAPDEPAQESIRQIVVAANHGAELTRQLLAYAGKGRVEIHRLQINRLIDETTQLLRLGVPRSITLTQQLAVALPEIEGDATQLRQVLMNIVLNGAEAIGKRPGTIAIATSSSIADRAYLADASLGSDLPEGRYVEIRISDTGSGMDEATRARIFEPFFTTKSTGRGLGLAAVLGIVRSHRGALKLQSKPGAGTMFIVLLPAVEQPQTERRISAEAHTP